MSVVPTHVFGVWYSYLLISQAIFLWVNLRIGVYGKPQSICVFFFWLVTYIFCISYAFFVVTYVFFFPPNSFYWYV